MKHFKYLWGLLDATSYFSKTPQLSWLPKGTANVRTVVSKQAVIKGTNGQKLKARLINKPEVPNQ